MWKSTIKRDDANKKKRIIREINSLVTSLLKTMILRKKCWFFRKIVHMHCALFWQKVRENNVFNEEAVKFRANKEKSSVSMTTISLTFFQWFAYKFLPAVACFWGALLKRLALDRRNLLSGLTKPYIGNSLALFSF